MLLIDGFLMLRQTGRKNKQLSSTKNQKMKRAPSPSSCHNEAASVSALCWGWLGEGFISKASADLSVAQCVSTAADSIVEDHSQLTLFGNSYCCCATPYYEGPAEM